jgi:SAM-dependent methyltransferase/uncharacterized protein YbaR (Trm112 family)
VVDAPVLVCPSCRTGLDHRTEVLTCRACTRQYPVVAGIPDLRLGGDPYLTLEEDREKASALAAVGGGLADLVDAYWRRTPEVPDALAQGYARTALDGARRGEVRLAGLGPVEGRLLDVGCGTGGLLVAAARRGLSAIGVDLALRWLVVARRALDEAGVDALLVAADGALLPFEPGSFDVVTSTETLEHAVDQRGFLHGCLSRVRPGGTVSVVTANRFTIAPEPAVRLWGVGLLPRRLAPAYVRRRRHTRYQFVRPVSRGELRSMIGPEPVATVTAAPLPPAPAGASRARRLAQAAYERLRGTRSGRRALTIAGPYLEVRR